MYSHRDYEFAVGVVKSNCSCRILSEIRTECGQTGVMSSDDEEDATNQAAEMTKEQPISEEEYRRMLRKHRKRRMKSKVGDNVKKISKFHAYKVYVLEHVILHALPHSAFWSLFKFCACGESYTVPLSPPPPPPPPPPDPERNPYMVSSLCYL